MKASPKRGNSEASDRIRLRVLIVEDSEEDTLLLLDELRRGGYETICERVESPEAMRRALGEGGSWEVVLSDWQMHYFGGLEALEILRQYDSEAPLVVVSKDAREEAVVEAIKAGACDYLTKGNLARLPAAVDRSLQEREARKERKLEKSIQESEERFRSLVMNSSVMITVFDPDGTRLYASPSIRHVLGYEPESMVGGSVFDLTHPEDAPRVREELATRSQIPGTGQPLELRLRHASGSWRTFECIGTNLIDDPSVGGIVYNCRDVTGRKRAEEELRLREAILRAVGFSAERFLKGATSWEESIEEVLEHLGQAAEVSRVYVFENYTGADRATWTSQRYEWVAPGVSAQIDNPTLKALPYRAGGMGRWEDTLGRGEVLHGHVREMPESERPGREAQGILSQAFVPIFVEGEWWGFIGFDECFAEREFSAAEIEALKAAADTLGAAIGRVRAERALRESEQRFKVTFEQAAVGVAHTGLDGSWLRVNQKLCEIVGYTRQELLERTFQDITHPDDVRADLDQLGRLRAGQIPGYSTEKRYFRKDASVVWINLTVSSVRAPSGEPAYLIAIVEDITGRKQTREALAQSEERYRAVVEQANEGIFLFDAATGDILESNAALRELLGYTAEEILSMGIYDLAAHDRESVASDIRLDLERGKHLVGERRARRKDGSLVDVEVTTTLISYGGREMICVVLRDVSERVEAFRMLEERLAALAGISASLTVDRPMESVLDTLAASVVEASAAVVCAVALIDEDTEELRLSGLYGQSGEWVKTLEASWRAGADSPILRAMRSHEPQLIRDARRFLLDDPLYAPVHPLVEGVHWDTVYIVPLVYRGGASGVIVTGYESSRDPGEDEAAFLSAVAGQTAVAVENTRLFAEAQGKAALEERQHLARELHDSVSQSLYGIGLGARTAHTLLDRESGPERVEEWLQYVLSLAEAGLSEMRALIFELRPESLHTEGLAAALEKQAAAIQARHELPVRTTLDDEPGMTLEAKEALYRIAQEALHNAAKHARAGRVELRLECNVEGIAMEISDDGVGFDLEGSFPGHLGLKSMRERAARVGGTLEVESAPGEGTAIHARIPQTA